MSTRIVVAGGGMVAGYVANELAELGLAPGDLTIVSADSALPYERPPLSKTFLSGKDTAEAIQMRRFIATTESTSDLRFPLPDSTCSGRRSRYPLARCFASTIW